ncbi:hypothetical protein I312_105089 [Cryptococcus bacillisporus CA1280]|uniref:uncharacterized protein n=1 Tax=Cryptococcus bacillisporus CA1280 TaxID=1296109 RepID=UPI00336887C0
MVAATGWRSSFHSSSPSQSSSFAPSVFDKVKSAWITFFSKFGFGKGKHKDEATLFPASPRVSESFLSFMCSLAPYPVSTRVQQPTIDEIDSWVSYTSSEIPVLNPIQIPEAIPIIAITNPPSYSLPSPTCSLRSSQDSHGMVKSPTFPETIYYELPLSKHISTSRTLKRVTWTRHFIKNTPKDVSRADNAKIKNNDKPIPRLDFGPILQSFDESEGEKESDIALTIDHEYEHRHLIDNYQSIKDEPPSHPLPTDFFGRQESSRLTNHQTSMMIPSLKQVSVYTPMLEQIRTRPEQGAYTADIIVRSESQPLDSQTYDHQCRILARQPKESYFSSVPSTNIPISQGQEQVEPYNGSFDQSISSLPSWYPYFSNSLDTLPKDLQDGQERPLLSNKISINSISSSSTSVDWPLFLINSTDNSNYSIPTQTVMQECTHPGKSPAGNTSEIVRNEVEHCGGEVFIKSCRDVLEDWKRKTIFGAIRQNESAWQGEDGNEEKDGQGIGSTSECAPGQQNAQDNDGEGRVLLGWTTPGETEEWQPFAEFGFRHDHQAFQPEIPLSVGPSDVKTRIPLSQLSIKSNIVTINVDHTQETMQTRRHHILPNKFSLRTRYTNANFKKEQTGKAAKNVSKARWSRPSEGALRM